MSEQSKFPPDLTEVLNAYKNEIFANINCVQIGKIEKVNDNQTVEIQIQIKRRVKNEETVNYPLLVDCPYFVLSGGGAYIDMPIAVGDYCLVIFNDRNIDNWWSTENVAEPADRRKHNLSDGIAIVGIMPESKALDRDGSKVRIRAAGYDYDVDADSINFNGNSKPFVTHAELNTALQTFITALNLHTHPTAATGPPSPPTAPMSLDISASQTTTVKTGG